MGQQDMLARLLRGNPDPGLPGYPVMQSAEDRGFRPIPFQGEGFQRMAAVLRGDVEPTPGEQMGMNVVRGFTEGPATIRAFHGSPHRFDRFDMSRIGTGEGAQAYGHGLYFAGNEGVARSYRDALSPISKAHGDVERFLLERAGTNVRTDDVMRLFQQDEALRPFAIPEIAESISRLAPNYSAAGDLSGDAVNALSRLDTLITRASPKGSMYEVNLNTTPDRLLDWDKPLPNVNPLRDLIAENANKAIVADWPEARNAGRNAMLAARNENLTGEGAHHQIRKLFETTDKLWPAGKNPNNTSNAALTAEALRERGIDGIKYLDGGSRAAGDGSRNYVMFDDKLIDILRRYGVAGTLGGGAAATAGTSE
jgi:hypothetical protein